MITLANQKGFESHLKLIQNVTKGGIRKHAECIFQMNVKVAEVHQYNQTQDKYKNFHQCSRENTL